MKTIHLSTYGTTITSKNVHAINGDIQSQLQSGEVLSLDFKGIKGVQMAAAQEMLLPIRNRYGVNYREKVVFANAEPIVKNAFVFSGQARGRFLQ